jgi:hypothetical protein
MEVAGASQRNKAVSGGVAQQQITRDIDGLMA